MKVGFIGMGIMGSRMAVNLLEAGHDVTVHNRTREKGVAAEAAGATWGETPAAAAKGCEVLITVLAHPEAVRAMALGEHGFLDALPEGSIWMDCSTVNPTFSREMAMEAGSRKVRFLDAPVGGSRGPAERGELTFLVGGDEKDLKGCAPLFDAMGNRTVHVGGTGMGASLKLVFNMLLGTSMAAFAEALALGQAMGVPAKMLLDALPGSPVVAPFISMKKEKIEKGDYDAEFPLRWMQKDLHLAAEAAYETGVATPSVNVAKDVFRLAIQHGLGDLDFSAIYSFLSEGAGED